jgi:beta-glucosidase
MCLHSDMLKKLPSYAVGLALFALSLSTYGQTSTHPDVERKVESILSQMTIEEKIDLLGGTHFFDVRDVPRLGLPLLHTADGPLGVRNHGPATVMAGGIALAATWNPALAEQTGTQLGRDARAKGKHFLLGPGVNIYRSPLNGRNFEYFGEDPWLAARMAVGYVQGVQSQGVCATIKHFMGNNSEFGRHTTDSIIDQRTQREIYLPAFEAAVKNAQVCAIMDSYNLTNGAHMTQNGGLNNDIVKKEWRFPGIIMSDWDATYDTIAAANGGLDLEMPSGKFLNRQALLPAIRSGAVLPASIDDKVRRLLREELRFGWLDRPAIDLSVPRYNQPGREVARAAAREGMVLLKNEGGLLPLDKKTIRTVAVIGPNAYPAVPVGGGSAQAAPFHGVSFLEGLSNYLGTAASVYWHRGIPALPKVAADTAFSTAPVNGLPGLKVEVYDNQNLEGSPATRTDEHVSCGTPLDMSVISGEDFDFSALASVHPVSVRWTGFYTPSAAGDYDLVVQQGGFGDSGYRLYLDDKLIRDSWNLTKAVVEDTTVSLGVSPHKVRLEYRSDGGLGGPFVRMGVVRRGEWVDRNAEQIARQADAVILAVGFDPASETEGWDRSFSLPPGQEELIQRIASVNKNTVVVITSGGGVDMGAWIDHVPGLIEAWYPGQEGGTALAEILFGDVNPSGRLPVTFERRWEDNPSHDHYYPAAGTNRIEYNEGVFVGYRGYERDHIRPLFPFGFGLSYTTFRFNDLEVSPAKRIPAPASGPLFEVAFSISNTGSRPGAAVAEIYVADQHASVPRPPKELKGFVKSDLKAGETRRVSVPLDARSLSFYDVRSQQWRAEAGTFKVMVGSSSENIELSGELKLNDTMVTAP